MTSHGGAQAKKIKTIKFHGDVVVNVVIFLRSQKDADIETFDAAGNPRVWLSGGDYEADSLTIRFTGQKWLQLARPRPEDLLRVGRSRPAYHEARR